VGLPRLHWDGDLAPLTDSVGTVVASYSYDAFGNLTASSESLPGGWSNPYRYDGAEGVRYDGETGLYWLSVRAYDPTLGRFLSHDPLGRLAAWGVDFQPYVYASNNPVVNTDPSGMVSCPIRMDGQCQSYWRKVSGVTNPPKPPPPPGCKRPGSCNGHGGGPLQPTTQGGTPPPEKPTCDWSHHCDDHKFNEGLGGTIFWGISFAALIGSFLIPGGVGFFLQLLLHAQASNIVHGLIGSIQEMLEGVYGTVSQALFALLQVVGDAFLLVLNIIDGVVSFKKAYQAAGDLAHLLTKFGNLFKHGLNGGVLGSFIGDIGNFLWQWLPTARPDWNNLVVTSHEEWGWNLPTF
jgi:RHS repeat-associated protein